MKTRSSHPVAVFFYSLVILAAFLLMAGAVWLMDRSTRPLPADHARAEQRRTATFEGLAAAEQRLHEYRILKTEVGQIGLPIERAMELVVEEWRNPEAAQTALVERWNRFNPPPPPPPPPPPSPYE